MDNSDQLADQRLADLLAQKNAMDRERLQGIPSLTQMLRSEVIQQLRTPRLWRTPEEEELWKLASGKSAK